MKLNYSGFSKHLASSKRAAIYLVEGDEALLVEEAVDMLHHALKEQGFLERLSVHVDANFKCIDLESLVNNFSLFAEKKRIQINCADKPPADLILWLQTYCAQIKRHDDICLIIKTAKLSSSEKKAKWVAAIDQAGVMLTVYNIEVQEFPAWLDARLAKVSIKLTKDARSLLIEQTEGNLLAAAQVIEKLTFLAEGKPLNAMDLQPLLAEDAHYDLFDLNRHVLLGDLKRALRIMAHLKQVAEPILILWGLAKELKILLTLYSQSRQVSLSELYRSLQVWDKRQKEVENALHRLSASRVSNLLVLCSEIDLTIKGLKEGDPWELLKSLIVRMAV